MKEFCIGLHFGHDASVCQVSEDGVDFYSAKERSSRCKHALGLAFSDFEHLINQQCRLIGLSTTQDVPIFYDEKFSVEVEGGALVEDSNLHFWSKLPSNHYYFKYTAWESSFRQRKGLFVSEQTFPWSIPTSQGFNQSYETMSMVGRFHPELQKYFSRPATLKINEREHKSVFYHHHLLHAQYASWATSCTKPALVITQDGGIGPTFGGGGLYFYTPSQGVMPVIPIDGWLGQFYDTVSTVLGFDASGGAGKLMGLAPYGRPWLDISDLVGTRYQVTQGYRLSIESVIHDWLKKNGITDTSLLSWDTATSVPPSLVADIAASAQVVVEVNLVRILRTATEIAKKCGFEFANICLAGGLALNCPGNSNLSVIADKQVLIPPAVNDEGLSIGAAVLAYHSAFGTWPAAPKTYAEACFIGRDIAESEVEAAASATGFTLMAGDPMEISAKLIASDQALAVLSGRSEVGPRALGHRSILANPSSPAMWNLVNKIKKREPWRPFAPAVLDVDADIYFDRGPTESRFMLFNYRCISKAFPATTHYDHSSRAQHVSKETGLLFCLLQKMKSEGTPPVLLNTSFNGPNVPIVETGNEAFNEAAQLGIAYILTDFGLFESASSAHD